MKMVENEKKCGKNLLLINYKITFSKIKIKKQNFLFENIITII